MPPMFRMCATQRRARCSQNLSLVAITIFSLNTRLWPILVTRQNLTICFIGPSVRSNPCVCSYLTNRTLQVWTSSIRRCVAAVELQVTATPCTSQSFLLPDFFQASLLCNALTFAQNHFYATGIFDLRSTNEAAPWYWEAWYWHVRCRPHILRSFTGEYVHSVVIVIASDPYSIQLYDY